MLLCPNYVNEHTQFNEKERAILLNTRRDAKLVETCQPIS